jgi:hypothetical protein
MGLDSISRRRRDRPAGVYAASWLGENRSMRHSIPLAFAILALLASCSRDDSPRTMFEEEARVALDPALGRAAADIKLIGGVLKIAPAPADSGNAAEARFRFDREEMRPLLTVDSSASPPILRAFHPPYDTGIGKSSNEWTVALAPESPLELDVAMMTGICDLDLAGLDLTRLEAKVDYGQLLLDFSKRPLVASCEVLAEAQSGALRVVIPNDVGVRVRARKAVGGLLVAGLRQEKEGEWVNDRFGGAGFQLDLSLGVGMGEITVDPAP